MKPLPVPHINRNVDGLLRKCGFSAAERLAAHLLMTEVDPETGHADFSLEGAAESYGLGSIRRTLDKLKKNGLAVRLRVGGHRHDNSRWDFGPALRCKPELPSKKAKPGIPVKRLANGRLIVVRRTQPK
jgi:hypothetical protein